MTEISSAEKQDIMASPDLSGDMEIKMPLMEEEEAASAGKETLTGSASIASSIMSLASSPAGSAAMGWVSERRQKVKPWAEFVNSKRFQPPASIPKLGRRLARNIDHFQTNYMYVFAVLIAYCLLTSPMLLLCIGASLGACYILQLKNKERKVKFMGKEVTLAQQYAGVGLASIPIFILAGAGTAVFWVIGASIVFIVMHAAFYNYESEIEDAFELQMEEI